MGIQTKFKVSQEARGRGSKLRGVRMGDGVMGRVRVTREMTKEEGLKREEDQYGKVEGSNSKNEGKREV